jgi:propanol-preferring alcohol dehydrogenase
MSDIPSFPYELLWHEKTLRSVANLTREDGNLFVERLRHITVQTTIRTYPLAQANQALDDLRCGALQGAAVLLP